MPHGLPDGALSGKAVTIFSAYDTAELAARLGSISVFDRSGNVIFMDAFDQTLTAWYKDLGGGVSDVYPVCYPTQRGALAMCLKSGATGIQYSKIDHLLPYPAGEGMGVEFAFVPADNLALVSPELIFVGADATLHMECRYYHEDGTLRLRTGVATWSLLATPGIQQEGFGCFINMKLVGNIITGKYTRVIFNGQEFDASAFDMYQAAAGANKYMGVIVLVHGDGTGSAEVVVDDVIITQNEPT